MYTKFGEFMRVLRIKHHEIMGDIADMLGVSLPFLSAVENGKRNVPADWVDKIVSHYNLSPEETQELLQMKLDLKSSEFFQRTAALQFARSFDNMDEDTAKRIIELLEGKGGNDN